uniref:Hexosyltransferase n=1 Tax=Lutzomyia longipalpis TaxID=7200 RepID=A0A1B0GLG6_LUTLO
MKRIQRVALLALTVVAVFLILITRTGKPPDSLLNLRDFHYTIQQPSCGSLGVNPLVVILVHSAPGNLRKRQTIRETWASWRRHTRVVFLVGLSQGHQEAIEHEANVFGDVVQGSFVDSYRNLTYKHAMALKWGSEECPQARYVFKADDDIFINIPALCDFLEAPPSQHEIFCTHLLANPVLRNEASAWYVSPEEYPNETYPHYCSGCGIIYPQSILDRLQTAFKEIPFFWIDDVFVSGIARQKASVAIHEIDRYVLQTPQAGDIVSGKLSEGLLDGILYSNEISEHILRHLWHKTQLRALDGQSTPP